MKQCLIILLLGIISQSLVAQEVNLRSDTSFFYRQMTLYQNWLEDVGLDTVFHVDGLRVRKEKLTLKLKFKFTAQDSAQYAWQRLNENFYASTGISLENRLFIKMIHLMEVQPEQANIRIKNTPKSGEFPQIDGRVVYDETNLSVALEGFVSRSEEHDSIDIPPFLIHEKYLQIDTLKYGKYAKQKQQEDFFQEILKEADTYFSERHDGLKVKPITRNPLVFKVENVKSEVITGSYFSIFNPNEYLTFTINFQQKEEGILLTCTVDGKVGSGLFAPRVQSNYREMDPEFSKELQEYVHQFTNYKIIGWLKD